LGGHYAPATSEWRDLGEARTSNNRSGTRRGDLPRSTTASATRLSQAGWDVSLADETKLQVKALRLSGARGHRNLGPIHDSDYDAVIVVIFDVTGAPRTECATVEHLFTRSGNGRIITVTNGLPRRRRCERPRVLRRRAGRTGP
jgi:hypothetical protein